MCELLVRFVDNPPTDDADTDCQRTQRGDVVVAMPDGHPWATNELAFGHWVVVKVPGMTLAEGEALAAGEPSDGAKRHRHKKLFYIDPAMLPVPGADIQAIIMDAATVRTAKRRKPPAIDPDIIGERRSPNVIG